MNRITCCVCLAAMMICLCGCDGSGSDPEAAGKAEHTYAGLANQKCAVMVWADLRTRAEYGQIQLDLAKLVQSRLEAETTPEEEDQKKKSGPTAEFLNPASVVRFQREHPEIDGAPIAEVAPRLGVARVIYIEIVDFSAQSAESIMLLKGQANATLRVIEVAGRQAHVAFEQPDIRVMYPTNAPAGVIPTDKINVRTIYEGTLQELADRIVTHFYERKE